MVIVLIGDSLNNLRMTRKGHHVHVCINDK